MNCEEIDELLGAFALEALEPEVMRQVERHLSYCRLHDEELAELRIAATRLPSVAEARTPPPWLRGRLLATFEAERSASDQVGTQTRAIRSLRRLFVSTGVGYAMAAIFIAAILGVVTWGLFFRREASLEPSLVRTFQGDAGAGMAVYFPERQLLLLEISLPQAATGMVYQAWTIDDGQASSIGVVPDSGRAAFPVDLESVEIVAISIEPAPYSLQPTSNPLLIAHFVASS